MKVVGTYKKRLNNRGSMHCFTPGVAEESYVFESFCVEKRNILL